MNLNELDLANRDKLPDFEIRYWHVNETSGIHEVQESYWRVIGYAHTRALACNIAESLMRMNRWSVHVWVIRSSLDPYTQRFLPCPSITDVFEIPRG